MKLFPKGVYPTMVTPFTADNKIDYNGVLELLHWYEKKQVDGIFAVCQSSEIFFLSFEERLSLLQFILKNRPKGMPIIASGHVADDIPTQLAEARAFVDEGVDAFIFISNRFASQDADDSVFLKHILSCADALSEVPLGIYECPYPYKRLVSPYAMREIAQTGRFAFLKDTCCDLDQIAKKLEAAKDTPLQIYNANSATLLESLRLGCAGFSGVMANSHPELYVWLCKNFESQPEKAKQVQDFLGFASLAELQLYPVNAKYHMMLEGLPIGFHTRSRDAKEFTRSKQMEIEQMHRTTRLFTQEILGI